MPGVATSLLRTLQWLTHLACRQVDLCACASALHRLDGGGESHGRLTAGSHGGTCNTGRGDDAGYCYWL